MDLKTLIPPLKTVVAFLDRHSGAVLAIVTTVYAFFTVLLWRATNRQANISRQIFESSHRPWLNVTVQGTELGDGRNLSEGLLRATIQVGNEGPLEAQITDWSVVLYLRDSKHQVRKVRAVNESENLELAPVSPKERLPFPLIFCYEGTRDIGMSFTLTVIVFYRGIAPWMYQTEMTCQGTVGTGNMYQRMNRSVARSRKAAKRVFDWIPSRTKWGTGRKQQNAGNG